MIVDYTKIGSIPNQPQKFQAGNKIAEVQTTKKQGMLPAVNDPMQRRYIPATLHTDGPIDMQRRQQAFVSNLYAPINFAKVTVRTSVEAGRQDKPTGGSSYNQPGAGQGEFQFPAPSAAPSVQKPSAHFEKIQERLQVRLKVPSLKPKDLPAVQPMIQPEKEPRPSTSATKVRLKALPNKEPKERPKSSMPGKRDTKTSQTSVRQELKATQEKVQQLAEEVGKKKADIEGGKPKKPEKKKPSTKPTTSAREGPSTTSVSKAVTSSPQSKPKDLQGGSPKLTRPKTLLALAGKPLDEPQTPGKSPHRASTPKEKGRPLSPLPVIEEMKAKSLVRNKKESVRTPGRLHNTVAMVKPSIKTLENSKVVPPQNEGISFETVNKVLRKEKREISQSQWMLNAFNSYSVAITAPKTRLRVYLGKGNNHQLIERLLRGRVFVETERLLNDCNIIWTQITCPSARPSLTCTTQKFFQRGMYESPFYKKSDLMTTEDCAEELDKLKIFKFDKKTVVPVFERVIQTAKLNSVMPEAVVIANHVKGLKLIARKAELAHTVIAHCKNQGTDPFTVIPLTYFVRGENFSADMNDLVKTIKESAEGFNTPYIVKPGEFTNRGKGITMAYSEIELRSQCSDLFEQNKSSMNAIVQKYIANPLLFKGRKFDFRCYALLVKGFAQATVYWYGLGYMRTSSYEYSLDAKDNLMVHLTNEAVQVTNQDTFGKHEPGNKMYYAEIEEYFNTLEVFRKQGKSFRADIIPEMKKKTLLTFEASLAKIVSESNEIGWELLGYDFMLDDNLNVWLIEINQNPCMSGLTPQQEGFISKLLEDTMM